MPLDLDARDRRSLAIAGGLFLLLVIVAFALAPDTQSGRDVASTYSTASGGAKAAWLLLQQAGYNVERWELPPAQLPDARDPVVLVLADPITYAGEADRARLRAFVEGGGRVIVAGVRAAAMAADDRAVPEMVAATWTQVPAVSLCAITRAASRITLARGVHWSGDTAGIPLYEDEGGVRVLARQVGKGEILLMASATPLTNAGLKEPGNLEFLLASIGPRAGTRILWDEYFHGYRRSLVASTARSPLRWLFLHLGIVALAVVLTFSRRHGPVFVPAGEVRLSPLEFVRTLGGLYERAGAASAAVDVAYSRFRYWVTRRLGAPVDASPAELEGALRERYRFEDAELRATLAACEAARTRPDLKPKEALRLVRALYRYSAALKLFGR